tara:strand:+ start:375 stop:908 length:534 start_codon:yes stop_codon:yes gene_type:complete
MNTHSSDRYDYYSDKELKEMAAGRRQLAQRGFWWDELDTEFKSNYDGTIHATDGSRNWPEPVSGADVGNEVKYPNVAIKKNETEVSKGDMWNGYAQKPRSIAQLVRASPSDSFPTAGYDYGTYGGTMSPPEGCVNTAHCKKTMLDSGMVGTEVIYPNLATAEPGTVPQPSWDVDPSP